MTETESATALAARLRALNKTAAGNYLIESNLPRDLANYVKAATRDLPALLDALDAAHARVLELEAVRDAAKDVLRYGGGHRSECYHAMKEWDGRERLFNSLAALKAQP